MPAKAGTQCTVILGSSFRGNDMSQSGQCFDEVVLRFQPRLGMLKSGGLGWSELNQHLSSI
jgi:hypothetical protein